jgi:uncharacterized protein YbjT (DUF2867 family)
MKYIITGAAGHVAAPLVQELLHKNQSVAVIGRSAEHLKGLQNAGATMKIGSVEDRDFLISAFAEADAAFLMYPPNNLSKDIKAFTENIAHNYKAAIEANHIQFAVTLSSIGAHLSSGAGPVSGLHRAEQILNECKGLHVLHLRPVYYYSNLLNQINLINLMGIMGGNFELSRFGIADPVEVGRKAARELLNLKFQGASYQYYASDEVSTSEIADEIGKALGKPGLRWVRFSNQQFKDALLHGGMSEELAAAMVEMFEAFDKGSMTTDYFKIGPVEWGTTKMSDFAKQFSQIYFQQTASSQVQTH